MSLAPQEIEKSASKYASAAIKYDSQGARGMALHIIKKQLIHYSNCCTFIQIVN